MPTGEEERHLSAIMFTDMVGYTALAQSDEEQALEVLDRHNRLLRPFFPKYNGKEVKTIGDSFLVEFASALDATRCAIEIQRFLHDYNFSSPVSWKVNLRIGIHLGDVVHRAGDVFGDAVNIASRIEPLAEPEGICISEQVFDQVRNKLDYPLERQESARLKNVRFPVTTYRIALPWERRGGAGSDSEQQETAVRAPPDTLSGGHRVAVLPFANISPDPNDEYFADGMTEELITAISSVEGIEVISRTSVMQYKKSSKPLRQISRELEVDSVLEGSVRKAGNRIRVTVQMIDALHDRHLWSETYDREFSDIFAIQSDIAQSVAKATETRFTDRDRMKVERGSTTNPEAHAEYLMGRYLMNRPNRDDSLSAIRYLERAVALDPSFAAGYAALADSYTQAGGEFLSEQEAFPKAKQFAEKAVELDGSLAEAHAALGVIAMQYEWDWSKASTELTRAIEINSNYSPAHLWYGVYLTMLMRRQSEGLRELLRAQELDPLSLLVKLNVGLGLYFSGRYDDAISKLAEARELDQGSDLVYIFLGLSYLGKSMREEAIAELKAGADLVETPDLLGILGYAYGLAGKRGEALELAEKLRNQAEAGMCPFTNLAIVHIGLGESERAVEYLEKALEERESWLALSSQLSIYDPIRSSPRFARVMEKVGLQC